MSKKHLLVTGGAGFIGSNFVNYWAEQHSEDKIVVLDALTYAGNRQNLSKLENNPNFVFVHGDICDRTLVDKILTEEAITQVAHFAAESHVDRFIYQPLCL